MAAAADRLKTAGLMLLLRRLPPLSSRREAFDASSSLYLKSLPFWH